MKKTIAILALALLAATTLNADRRRSASSGTSPFAGTSGHWQWVHQGFNDAPSAYAYAAAMPNVKPAIVVVTGDPRVPYVVFYYVLADLWMGPDNFTAVVSDENDALVKFHYFKTITYHKAGYTTMPDGLAIAWYTF